MFNEMKAWLSKCTLHAIGGIATTYTLHIAHYFYTKSWKWHHSVINWLLVFMYCIYTWSKPRCSANYQEKKATHHQIPEILEKFDTLKCDTIHPEYIITFSNIFALLICWFSRYKCTMVKKIFPSDSVHFALHPSKIICICVWGKFVPTGK